jgi:hypothetical protein
MAPRSRIILDDSNRPLLGVDEVMVALLEHDGDVSAAAEAINRPRWKVQKLIDETPTLQMIAGDLQASIVDQAESVLKGALDNDDIGTARLVVTTLGKNRGWTPRQEMTGKDGRAVQVTIEGPDANL